MKFIGRLLGTILAVALAGFLWLYFLEEMGLGAWECWPT